MVDLSGFSWNQLYQQLKGLYNQLSGMNVARELILP